MSEDVRGRGSEIGQPSLTNTLGDLQIRPGHGAGEAATDPAGSLAESEKVLAALILAEDPLDVANREINSLKREVGNLKDVIKGKRQSSRTPTQRTEGMRRSSGICMRDSKMSGAPTRSTWTPSRT